MRSPHREKRFRTVPLVFAASPYTVLTADEVLPVNASGGAFLANLPAVATVLGMAFTFVKTDATANTVTLDPSGGETIDGALTYVLMAQGDAVTIIALSTGWQIISYPIGSSGVSDSFAVLVPEGSTTGNATRVGQTTFDGASYLIQRAITTNRLLFRLTGFTAGGTCRILLFQAPAGKSGDGTTGPTSRIGTIAAFAPGGTGNFLASFAEGLITVQPGLLYVLFGRDSAVGSVTYRTRTTQALDLLTGNEDLQTHPTNFTTAIAATTSPATFDPREAPTGQATGTASDVTLNARLYTV